jgi:hypothetical protein
MSSVRVVAAIGLFAVASVLWIWIGAANADEGWYLVASQLVFTGKLPYRDFAFTQAPLLPYLYGIPQLLPISPMYAGRFTSWILFVAGTVVACSVVGRRARPAVWVFLAAAIADPWAAYFSVIVKTYALTSLLFIVVWALLGRDRLSPAAGALAAALAIAAVGVRLSAAGFAIPVLAWLLWTASSRRARIRIASVALVTSASLAGFLLPAPDVARWHLIGHHIDQWSDPSLLHRVDTTLTHRFPRFMIWFWPYLTLVALVLVVRGRSRSSPRTPPAAGLSPDAVCALGLCGFGAAHFVTGGWHMEYFVPVLVAGTPILVVVAHRAGVWSKERRQWRIAAAAAATAGLALFAANRDVVDLNGGQVPIQQIRELAKQLEPRLAAGEPIAALEATSVAVELRHPVLPGLEMGPFSVYRGDAASARRLHVMTGPMIADLVDRAVPGAVVLTHWDWKVLAGLGQDAAIRTSLSARYELVAHRTDFGQLAGTVDAYVRVR